MWLGVAYFGAGSSKVSPSLHAALKKRENLCGWPLLSH